MAATVRRVRRKSQKQKIRSLATPRVQMGPDNDGIKQKHKTKKQKTGKQETGKQKTEMRKRNSLATPRVQTGPDNVDIKQKDAAPFH